MTTTRQYVVGPEEDLILGRQFRKNSIVFGIIGLFIFGVVFGAMAFLTARKAEAYGVQATAGKVLGIVGFVLGAILSIAYFVIR
ncbi:hypothetical protein ACFRJ9_13075 [Paenarthrobacter sp. NPDC056912]|uniref:hypothetical protein n=1 Tax=Paenarthrobacter sp. NPDC056912 TaxID=3345965 RepID=UPI00366BF9BE